MTVAQALLSFAVVAGLLTLVPGVDTALVVRSVLTRGRGYAFGTAFGIISGPSSGERRRRSAPPRSWPRLRWPTAC